jgi:putative transposase
MENSTVTPLVQPGAFSDLLTEVLRSGAQRLLAHAVEAEVSVFIAGHSDQRLDDGRARIVRHGHLPKRDIQTGIGPVRVQQPRVRDRGEDGSARIHFFTEHLAQTCAAHEELGCGFADPLFEGDFLW